MIWEGEQEIVNRGSRSVGREQRRNTFVVCCYCPAVPAERDRGSEKDNRASHDSQSVIELPRKVSRDAWVVCVNGQEV